MARTRSRRKKSNLRRLAVPIGAAMVLVACVYFLLPGRSPSSADASPGNGANMSEQAPAEPEQTPPILAAETKSPAGNNKLSEPSPQPERSSTPAEADPGPLAQPDSEPAGNTGKPPADPAPASTKAPLKDDAGPTTRSAAPSPAPAPANTQALISQSILLEDQSKFLEARALLNDALQAGRLDHAAADALKARIRELNQTIVFTPRFRSSHDAQQAEYIVQPGDVLVKICRNLDVPPNFIARVNAVKPERIRQGQSLKIIKGPIHAVVSKKHFTMDLYLGALPGEPGSVYLTTYRVGLGEHGSTPTGLWEVHKGAKAENPSWVNPRTNERFDADDPDNPLGERWIGLTGISGKAVGAVSYGIHGTIEPESIGTNASMGCIRLKHEDVVELFDMLSEGRSTVLVVDE